MQRQLSFSEAVGKLAKVGLKGHHIFLIDLVLLCEMAWADGSIQDGERELVFSYLNHHIEAINRLAGCKVMDHRESRELINGLIENRPSRELISTIHEVISTIRLDPRDALEAEKTSLTILNACLDVAASSVTKYPYGLTERFTIEEKEYYHKLAGLLGPRGQ